VPYFQEKHYAVEVRDGQLNIDFEGSDWACAVSAIIVYPDTRAAEGRRFLNFVKARRRFHFDNTFKRVLPLPSGPTPQPTQAEQPRGFIVFNRNYMKDVHINDRPLAGEYVKQLTGSAFAGELEPVTVSLLPLRDLGQVSLAVTDLKGAGAAMIPAAAVRVGHV